MKRLLSVGVAGLMALAALSGCNKNGSETTPQPEAGYAGNGAPAPSPEEVPDAGVQEQDATSERDSAQETTMRLQIGEKTLTATLADNSSAEAFAALLAEGPLTIAMHDYGSMEKVGELGTSLPTNDEQITTAPGDLILYMGKAFVIYYAPNSWNFTRLGRINNVTGAELKGVLGSGDVTVTLSVE